jgi:hypothetical protein
VSEASFQTLGQIFVCEKLDLIKTSFLDELFGFEILLVYFISVGRELLIVDAELG